MARAKKKATKKRAAKKAPARRRGNHSSKLTREQQLFVIRELACYSGPKQTADLLKERYGVEIVKQTVAQYDPKLGKLSDEDAQYFHEQRKHFLENILESIPEANKAVRVRKMAEAARRAEERGNDVGMVNFLVELSKELGNVHTNRREHTGKDGGPIQSEDVSQMSDEQLNALYKRLTTEIREAEGAE